MQTLRKIPLIQPRAAISQANKPEDSWYTIRAAARGVAEIMLYDDIGAWGISARQFARDLAALGDVSQINLRIHSGGGDVMDGTAMYNILRGHSARVEVYIDGMAASMASVVAMAGDVIYMPANATMMVHKPWGGQVGDADDMREYADLLDKVEGTLIQAYARKTGKSAEEIAAMLKKTTWMDGNEAVAAGFADQVLEPLKAAAQLSSKRLEEYTSMPEAMRTLMSPRASTPNPTPTPKPTQDPVATVITDDMRAQVLAAETARRTAIATAFGGFAAGHAELLRTCQDDPQCTEASAREKLLAALGDGSAPVNVPTARHPGHVGNGNIVGDSVRASISARVGQSDMEAGNPYNYMRLHELARASLEGRGISCSDSNPMVMVGLAFTHTSSDFGNILLDIANKSVLKGWEDAPETFEQWTKKGQLSDFKPSTRVGLGSFSSLREVRPGAEYQYVSVGDRGEQIVLGTYGELFTITRQAIINDDLSMLTDIPRLMGRAAKGTIGDLVYAVLTGNPQLRDGKTLFHADRNNLLKGAASALSVASLSAAKTAMRTQKGQVEGGKPRTLNIRPEYVLVPVALEDTARQIIASESVQGANNNSGIKNPIKDFAQVIGEPRLDDVSAIEWYMAAGQGNDTVEVAYLNGVDVPYIEQLGGFPIDGVATKVRIDAGVSPLDSRGLGKSLGK